MIHGSQAGQLPSNLIRTAVDIYWIIAGRSAAARRLELPRRSGVAVGIDTSASLPLP